MTTELVRNRKMLLLFFGIAIEASLHAQVTIGMSEAPSKTALLQLKTQPADNDNVTSTKGGLLLPRVKLVSLNTLQPFIDPTDANYATEKELSTGLLVYNINDDETSDLHAGTYTWNGEEWEDSSANIRTIPPPPSGSGAVKINVNQSKFITLSGTQSYGLLMENQGANINPQYVTGVYPGGTTTGSPFSVITTSVGNNGNNEALLLEATEAGKANFYRMNMQFTMGNNPPAQTRYFDVSIVSVGSGALVYQNSVVVPGGLNTGHVAYFQIFFPTIADASSIGRGYRIIFGADTAASQGLPNNIGVKVVDITRINQ